MNGKWTYIESKTLGQTIAFDEISGWIICKDGTRYSPAELRLISNNWKGAAELPLSVHLLKKEFGGTIVSVTEKPPRGAYFTAPKAHKD